MTKAKHIVTALMASTLFAVPAVAAESGSAQKMDKPAVTQTAPKPMAEAPAAVKTAQEAGQWRTSKFVGLDVYNASNEKIGDINELIMGSDGQIDLVVIGVGGFLGMGEHDVALKWDQVKFVAEPVKSTSTPARNTTGTNTGTTGSGAGTVVNAENANREYPDHAIVSMTKDQLKALPQFKYASDTKSR
jgi:hypothetical protein